MKVTTILLLLLCTCACGSKFKAHVNMRIMVPIKVRVTEVDLNDHWPFKSTLEKADPYLSELIIETSNQYPLNQDEGKIRLNSDPFPSSLFSWIFPPSFFTKVFTIDKPRPDDDSPAVGVALRR
ncbi:hypothetical protein SAMN05421640_3688 [Ekhidna lutea]|uniref:Uncharacterized protein n=1 Tax=Ekhidna lutea TaxID=447679 RepID=A0A239M932_EKHLU|nr:hypothetical protein SAMN05421640_3688 [Ekhidna lutea]